MSGQVGWQVLSGDGGVGKSQLAASVFWSSDADLRVWVQGDSRAAIVTRFVEAAVRLDLDDRNVESEALVRHLLGFLAATERSWLLVIDDLADPADMNRLWPTGRGRVMVTTRRRDAALSGGGRQLIDVGTYRPDEAEAYLSDRLAPFTNDLPADALGESPELAADLGFLPLGLAHAAAVIIDQGASCAMYRSWFADRSRGLQELFPGDADGYDRTLVTTWSLAIEAANQLDPAGLARPLAYMVAVCDPAGAPEALFTSNISRRYLADMLEQQEVISAEHARRGLRALHRLSLISHNTKNSDPRAVRMHNLTARAILHTLTQDDQTALVQIAADALREIWPSVENDTALSEALRANTQALRRVAENALWDHETGGHDVLFRAGYSLYDAGLAGLAVAYYTELTDQAWSKFGPDHPDTLGARNDLASAYRSAGDLGRAIPLLEQTLADRERVLGHDHPDTLGSNSNLAGAYQAAGDLDRAIPLMERTVADYERVLGTDHPDTLRSRDNLVGAYQAAADLDRAIPLMERTIADYERILGPDHPNTLTARNNLAHTYHSAGDLDRAIPVWEQTVADSERVLGPNHPTTLTARNNLASAYHSAGDLDRAIPLLQQTVTDSERVLGPDHPNTLNARNNLAGAYLSAGHLDQAIQLWEQAVADCERVLGPDHPDTLTTRDNLGYAHLTDGDLDQAIQLWEQAVAGRERVLGPDHPDTLATRNNLAHAKRIDR